MGVTRACFNPDGTVPVDKNTLTILVTRGARVSHRYEYKHSRVDWDTYKYIRVDGDTYIAV